MRRNMMLNFAFLPCKNENLFLSPPPLSKRFLEVVGVRRDCLLLLITRFFRLKKKMRFVASHGSTGCSLRAATVLACRTKASFGYFRYIHHCDFYKSAMGPQIPGVRSQEKPTMPVSFPSSFLRKTRCMFFS